MSVQSLQKAALIRATRNDDVSRQSCLEICQTRRTHTDFWQVHILIKFLLVYVQVFVIKYTHIVSWG